jgi:hypothetical protein
MASDVWALGATLYELFADDAPFGDHGGVIQKSGAEIPEIKADYSFEMKQIVERCLSLDAWERPTAEMLVVWTEQYRRGEKIQFGKKPKDSPRPPKPPKPPKIQPMPKNQKEQAESHFGTKSKNIIVTVAICIVLGIATLVTILFLSDRSGSLYEDFKEYVDTGDELYEKGESSYREALSSYNKAIKILDTGKIDSYDKKNVTEKQKNVSQKIDEIFNFYVKAGNNLLEKGNEISKQQAISNFENALKFKDDEALKKKLEQIKNDDRRGKDRLLRDSMLLTPIQHE